MKFLLNENVERRFLSYLQQLGHNTTVVGDDYPHGLLDREVLAIAKQEGLILLTNDRSDFGELIFRHHLLHCGVILIRIRSGDITTKKTQLLHVLHEYDDQLHGFLVITSRRVRVRKSIQNIAA